MNTAPHCWRLIRRCSLYQCSISPYKAGGTLTGMVACIGPCSDGVGGGSKRQGEHGALRERAEPHAHGRGGLLARVLHWYGLARAHGEGYGKGYGKVKRRSAVAVPGRT